LAVFGGDALGGEAREPRALAVHLISDAGKIVVGLRDRGRRKRVGGDDVGAGAQVRSEEHTSELQSRSDLVCRLLLEKKKINIKGVAVGGLLTAVAAQAVVQRSVAGMSVLSGEVSLHAPEFAPAADARC